MASAATMLIKTRFFSIKKRHYYQMKCEKIFPSMGLNLGRGGKGANATFPSIFITKNSFFWLLNLKGTNKKLLRMRGKIGICILSTLPPALFLT
jgi:hypothetical protein